MFANKTPIVKSLSLVTVFIVAGISSNGSSAQTATFEFADSSVNIGLRYTDNSTETLTIRDGDGDGMVQFSFDTLAVQTFYAQAEDCIIWDILGTDVHEPQAVPLFKTPVGDSLITLLDLTSPVGVTSLGERIPVVDGQTTLGGFSILQEPSVTSLSDLMARDFNTLPRYTGDAVVSSLIQFQSVSEPNSILVAAGVLWAAMLRRRKRERSTQMR